MTNMPTPTDCLQESFEEAARAGERLYQQGLVSAPGVSLSFLNNGRIYITREDCDFRLLSEEDFACVTRSGKPLNNIRQNEDLPLHLPLYRQRGDTMAAIHAHGVYTTLWSHLEHDDPADAVPAHTPHFRLTLGKVTLVSFSGYDSPGYAFRGGLNGGVAYLLKGHGAVVCGSSIAAARGRIELLEEASRFAWMMRGHAGIGC